MKNYLFTQCAGVLLDATPTLTDLERKLGEWNGVPQKPMEGEDGWIASGPGFVVEVRGRRMALVDLVDRPWPDDPRAPGAPPALQAAWEHGVFGLSSTPGALARAKAQCWAWPDGPAVAER